MRFLLDNMVSDRVFNLLKSWNHDAVNLRQLGLEHLNNGDIHLKATELDRIVLTYDHDFEEIGKTGNTSIILIQGKSVTDPNILPLMKGWINQITPDQHRNHRIIFDKDGTDIQPF